MSFDDDDKSGGLGLNIYELNRTVVLSSECLLVRFCLGTFVAEVGGSGDCCVVSSGGCGSFDCSFGEAKGGREEKILRLFNI